jgi:hypothetical protein
VSGDCLRSGFDAGGQLKGTGTFANSANRQLFLFGTAHKQNFKSVSILVHVGISLNAFLKLRAKRVFVSLDTQ